MHVVKQPLPERLSADFHYRGPRSPEGQVLQKLLDQLLGIIRRHGLSDYTAHKCKSERERYVRGDLHDMTLELKEEIGHAETEFFRSQLVDPRIRIETCAQYNECGILWVVDEYTDDPKAIAYSDVECPHCRDGIGTHSGYCDDCAPLTKERVKARERIRLLKAETERLISGGGK